MSKDGAVFAKGKIKGDVNYPPFEDLDEDTRHEINKFHVYPLGKIELYCRHIPYNSEKKSFLEKTGRESFEGTIWLTSAGVTPLTFLSQYSSTFSRLLATTRIIRSCGTTTSDSSASLHSSSAANTPR